MSTRASTSSGKSPRESNQVPQIGGFAALMDKYRRTLAGFTDDDEDDEELVEWEEEKEAEDNYFSDTSIINIKFSNLQVVAFSSVIQESLDKIRILGLIGGLPNVKASLDNHSLFDKYEKEDTQSFIFDPETLEAYEGSKKKQMLIKFQKDRSYIEEVLNEAHEDMIHSSSINKFMLRLKQFRLAQEEREDLLRETSENLAEVKQLTAQMEKDKCSLSTNLHKKSEILGKLKDEYEVCKFIFNK